MSSLASDGGADALFTWRSSGAPRSVGGAGGGGDGAGALRAGLVGVDVGVGLGVRLRAGEVDVGLREERRGQRREVERQQAGVSRGRVRPGWRRSAAGAGGSRRPAAGRGARGRHRATSAGRGRRPGPPRRFGSEWIDEACVTFRSRPGGTEISSRCVQGERTAGSLGHHCGPVSNSGLARICAGFRPKGHRPVARHSRHRPQTQPLSGPGLGPDQDGGVDLVPARAPGGRRLRVPRAPPPSPPRRRRRTPRGRRGRSRPRGTRAGARAGPGPAAAAVRSAEVAGREAEVGERIGAVARRSPPTGAPRSGRTARRSGATTSSTARRGTRRRWCPRGAGTLTVEPAPRSPADLVAIAGARVERVLVERHVGHAADPTRTPPACRCRGARRSRR